jgi:hypothetical protein
MLPPNAGSERKNADIKYIGDGCFQRAAAGPGRNASSRRPRALTSLAPPSRTPARLVAAFPPAATCGTQHTLARGTQRARPATRGNRPKNG